MRHDCEVTPEDLGPYLLGHLPEEEATRVRDAIARCPACSAEVSDLAPVVVAMSAASPEVDAPRPTRVDDDVLDVVLATVAREQRAERRRRWFVAAVAAAVAAVLVVGGIVLAGVLGDGEQGRRVQLAGSDGTGSAVLVDAEPGTKIDLEVDGLPPGRYGVWLEDHDGERVSAGTFWPNENGWASLQLVAGMELEDSDAIGVTLIGGDEELVGDLDVP